MFLIPPSVPVKSEGTARYLRGQCNVVHLPVEVRQVRMAEGIIIEKKKKTRKKKTRKRIRIDSSETMSEGETVRE